MSSGFYFLFVASNLVESYPPFFRPLSYRSEDYNMSHRGKRQAPRDDGPGKKNSIVLSRFF